MPIRTTESAQRVLILCTSNSARSQIAEALLRHIGGDRYDVSSAGTHPTAVSAAAITVLGELGISAAGLRAKHVSEFDVTGFDYVMTVCDRANEECPTITARVRRLHWSLPDPAVIDDEAPDADPLMAYRRVRDALADILSEFVHAHRSA